MHRFCNDIAHILQAVIEYMIRHIQVQAVIAVFRIRRILIFGHQVVNRRDTFLRINLVGGGKDSEPAFLFKRQITGRYEF